MTGWRRNPCSQAAILGWVVRERNRSGRLRDRGTKPAGIWAQTSKWRWRYKSRIRDLRMKPVGERAESNMTEPTGFEPSVAPRVPSVTAHPLQACCSRCKHLQTQALLPQAAPIQHLSLLTLHTHNVIPGLIHRAEVLPPNTGSMSCAGLSKAKRSARLPQPTASPMKRSGAP